MDTSVIQDFVDAIKAENPDDNSTYTDYKIFMPYSELEVGTGEYHLKVTCTLWEYSSGSAKKVASSKYVNFKFTR